MAELKPFQISGDLFAEATEHLGLDEAARELLTWAMRETHVAIPIRLDDGVTHTFHGYRVQHSSARGPTIGGLRWHPDTSIEGVRALAARMSWQTAVVDLPLGGASGGVNYNPKELSTGEKERLARGYVRAFAHQFGTHRDVPFPDLYTTPQIMAWMMDEYESVAGESRPGATAGKPLALGGSMGHGDAGARTAAILVRESAAHIGLDPATLRYAIQGFGNSGRFIATLHPGLLGGGKLLAVSDSRGGVFNKKGLEVDALVMHKLQTGSVTGFSDGEPIDNEALLQLDVDVLYPAAVSDVISAGNAEKIKARIICELADNATTEKADLLLHDRDVVMIPDLLTNAGHVIVTYFELLQNTANLYWSPEDIHSRLETRIQKAHREVLEMSQSDGVRMRLAAWMVGIARVAEACRARGWC